MRHKLLNILANALNAVNGRVCVAHYLTDFANDQPAARPWYLIAVGKAAPAMAAGAWQVLGVRIADGLVITKDGHCTQSPVTAWPCLEAGHPRPDERSLAAGERLLSFVEALPPGAPVLSLISGGASALVEVPAPGVGLSELQRANDWLLGSGLDIAAMNRVRRALSRIKGGRLGERLAGHTVVNLLISDVPGDRPETIGSGLFVPVPSPERAPEDSSEGPRAGRSLPPWLAALVASAPPEPHNEVLANIQTRIIATNTDARAAAIAAARGMGLAAFDHGEVLSGDAAACGIAVARTLCEGPDGLHVWGGETTVELPEQSGRGGRNQSVALAAATVLAGRDDACLLALGTDGTDGPTEDAGGLVDGDTVARGAVEGLEAEDCLRRADAGTFLAASGDMVHTGPTGTNVMDVVLALKRSATS